MSRLIKMIYLNGVCLQKMIEISQNGLKLTDPERIKELQKEFSEKKCIVLTRLLDKNLIEKILLSIENAHFQQKEHTDNAKKLFGTDLSIQARNLALHQVHLLLNNVMLFRLVEQITLCKPINGFSGRIYRNMPDAGHKLDWHDDTEDETRIIAMSMNLSRQKYSGGIFQIREKESGRILCDVPCGNPGDAHIFCVSPKLQHQVTETTGSFPRTAAAGWFIDQPYTGLKFQHVV